MAKRASKKVTKVTVDPITLSVVRGTLKTTQREMTLQGQNIPGYLGSVKAPR